MRASSPRMHRPHTLAQRRDALAARIRRMPEGPKKQTARGQHVMVTYQAWLAGEGKCHRRKNNHETIELG